MHALFLALPNMLNVTIIMLFFFLMFGILLVSYFKGKMFDCNMDQVSSFPGEVGNVWDCLSAGGEWQNHEYNFDNILVAM